MGTPTPLAFRPETAAEVWRAARERRRAADDAEADLLRLAVDWASMHAADSLHPAATQVVRGFGQTDLALAGEGAPTVAEFAVAEFAVAIGLSTEAGKSFLGEALELRHRLPGLWERVTRGDLAAWKARRVARETVRLSAEAASYVDTHVAPVAHKIKPAQLDCAVNEAIGRFMPEEVERLAAESWDKRHVTLHDQLVSFPGTMTISAELDIADALDLEAAVATGAEQRAQLGSLESLDVRRAQAIGDLARGRAPPAPEPLDQHTPPNAPVKAKVKPRQVVLYVPLSQAALAGSDPVARLERGQALVGVEQVRSWCGRPDTHVIVKPVIDLEQCT